MTRRTDGIALITTLAMMVVLMLVVGLLTVSAVSDLQQSRASVQLTQARALAEAGEVYARVALASEAREEIRDILRPQMNTTGVNPAVDGIIPQSAWSSLRTSIESMLNAGYGEVASSDVDDLGTVSVSYTLDNFRGNLRSNSSQSYLIDYTVLSTGTSTSGSVRRVQDRGVFEIQLGRPSLSQYLFLVEDAAGTHGFFPTGSRFNGPVHANSNWGFRGSPEFLDTISTAASGAWFYSASGCSGGAQYINGDSRPPCTVPIFAKGFTRNAHRIDLPTSSLSQRGAALGLDPDALGSISNSTICRQLRLQMNCSGSPTITQGVYLVNDGSSVTGGIYIQGDVSSITLDGSGRDGIQRYVIVQSGLTYRIDVDHAADQTTVTSPTNVVTVLSGVPNGGAPLGTGGPTGQIFVNGTINNLKGPGRVGTMPSNPPDHPVPPQVRPALALETQLNITATGRIDLTSDLVYECDPTALGNSSYLASFPRCDMRGELLPTVLGVMSRDSDVRITTSTPNDLYLWGSYLAGTANRGVTVQNYNTRGPQGTLRLYGGIIQHADQLRGTIYSNGNLASGYMETFDYDLRFANGVVAPPNFPTVRTFDVQSIVPVKLSFREF